MNQIIEKKDINLEEGVYLLQSRLNEEDLQEIMKLDKTFYTDVNYDLQWYIDRYLYNMGFLLYKKKNLIGYIMAVPIKDNLYTAIKDGLFMGDLEINPQLYNSYESKNPIYIASALLKKSYRKKGYAQLIMNKIMEEYPNNKMCCIAISKDGHKLASKYLTLHKNLPYDKSVFIKE